MSADTIMVRILRQQGEDIDRLRFGMAADGAPLVARDAWVREAIEMRLAIVARGRDKRNEMA